MVAVWNLFSLWDGLGAWEVLGCEESVDFSLKDLHSLGQDVRFGRKFRELGVFESQVFFTHHKGTLGQL